VSLKNIEYHIDENGCHICTSHSKDKNGYIHLWRDGLYKAHRWIFYKATGIKPEVVMHTCDNPSCININHLKAGTFIENNKDRDDKGRNGQIVGDECPWAKLTKLDVKWIKLWIKLGYRNRVIGKIFKVHEQTISSIKNNYTWKSVNI
jgi:hypothetical protein